MLGLEEIKSSISGVLPFTLGEELLEEIAYGCSSITFREEGESLFRPGDTPKGFYWIMKGPVLMQLSDREKLMMRDGAFIGLDNFSSGEHHQFNVFTADRNVQTLFVDRRCYTNLFLNKLDLSTYVLQQHLNQLILLKNRIRGGAVA
jgi:CRP-like cAMP-binding protein